MEKSLGNGYTIDDHGRIYSEHKNAYLNPSINDSGYYFYTIYIEGKQKSILPHLEIWKQFIGDLPFGGIKHLDKNKLNNSLSNLTVRHPADDYVNFIRRGISITKIARHYGLPKKEISKRVSEIVPGGIRELRKLYPLNRSIDIT